MKKLNLSKSVGIEDQTYKHLVIACLNHVNPQIGINIEEQRKRMRILDAVEKANDELVLEDADAEILKGLVNAMPWAVVKKEIVQFSDDVSAMENVIPNET